MTPTDIQTAILALSLEERLVLSDWMREQKILWAGELEAERHRQCLHLRVQETEWGDWHVWHCKDCGASRKTSIHRKRGATP